MWAEPEPQRDALTWKANVRLTALNDSCDTMSAAATPSSLFDGRAAQQSMLGKAHSRRGFYWQTTERRRDLFPAKIRHQERDERRDVLNRQPRHLHMKRASSKGWGIKVGVQAWFRVSAKA